MRRRGRPIWLLALVAVTAALALGGSPANGDTLHPLTVVVHGLSSNCHWGIGKTASMHGAAVPNPLVLAVNQVATIDYTVTVTKTCTQDVTGTVLGPGNPSSVAVTVGGVAATTSCSYDAGADAFSCTYDGAPATTADGTVSAVATYPNGTATGSAPYSFAGVTPGEDTVDVIDSFQGVDTPLALHLGQSAAFHYSHDVTFHDCGHRTVDNTARVQDGSVLASSTVSIPVDVPCPGGCTLTPGYWKTHSKYGPAPSDPAWNLVPGGLGPDTAFFLSGASWYAVLNTPPAGGNAYYILSFQYIAARINILNGASSTSSVSSALAAAATFFQTYTPAQAAAFGKSSAARQSAIAWASTLGDYNSGVTGPGHCSE